MPQSLGLWGEPGRTWCGPEGGARGRGRRAGPEAREGAAAAVASSGKSQKTRPFSAPPAWLARGPFSPLPSLLRATSDLRGLVHEVSPMWETPVWEAPPCPGLTFSQGQPR